MNIPVYININWAAITMQDIENYVKRSKFTYGAKRDIDEYGSVVTISEVKEGEWPSDEWFINNKMGAHAHSSTDNSEEYDIMDIFIFRDIRDGVVDGRARYPDVFPEVMPGTTEVYPNGDIFVSEKLPEGIGRGKWIKTNVSLDPENRGLKN